jgi:hypothetical protein
LTGKRHAAARSVDPGTTRPGHQPPHGAAQSFVVEPTEYGWSVSLESERVGLFMTQRQALEDVRKRRSRLSATGQDSTLYVTGSDPEPSSTRSPFVRRDRR